MKARVKATGEIVEVSPYWTEIHTTNGGCYEMTEVDLIHEVPDYWDRLLHQYAGMAMQGLLVAYGVSEMEMCIKKGVEQSIMIATALVNRLKEESKCEK